MKKSFRIGLRLGLLAGLAAAVAMARRARQSSAPSESLATGVHGDWPPVTRASGPTGPLAHTGDHHPVGRVQVPAEAAPMGAPPALSDPVHPGHEEPEVPVPAETLDAPPPAGAPNPATAPASSGTKAAAKKAPAKKAATKKASGAGRAPAKQATSGAKSGKSNTDKGSARAEGAGAAAEAIAPWVLPQGSVCPASHPVKAKLSSRLFHLPGMLAYKRTVPDRCYVDATAAEADGLTKAKR